MMKIVEFLLKQMATTRATKNTSALFITGYEDRLCSTYSAGGPKAFQKCDVSRLHATDWSVVGVTQ